MIRVFEIIILALTGAVCFNARAAKKVPLVYVDADSLCIINKARPDGPSLQRLDVARYPDLTPIVRRYYSYPTGMAVAFSTDSPYIYAVWTTTGNGHGVNTTAIAQSGLALYIRQNGKWVFAGVGKPSYNKVKHKGVIVDDMDDSVKECLLYLPVYDGLDSLRIGVAPGSVIRPLSNAVSPYRLVVIGSSITHGSGVSNPGMAYPARMQRELGIEVVNLGASGQCKLEPFFARIAADTEADMFLFDCFSNPSAEQIDERLEAFVDIVRSAHPDTPLVFLQTLRRETANFNRRISGFENAKQDAARRNMAKVIKKYDGIYFIDPGMPIGDDHNATVDGVHPTDLGFERILDVILPQIKEIM